MKKLISTVLTFLLGAFVLSAQREGWHHLDLERDSVFGISTEKAYSEILQYKRPRKVVVAVIDSGVDIEHKDLQNRIWKSTKEVSNHRDDDANGFIDDLYGWNFIGKVYYDNFELTRLVRDSMDFYDSLSYVGVPSAFRSKYQSYRKLRETFNQQREATVKALAELEAFQAALQAILKKMGKSTPCLDDFEQYQPADELEAKVRNAFVFLLGKNNDFAVVKAEQVDSLYEQYKIRLNYHLNTAYDPRRQLKRSVIYDTGDNDVKGPNSLHGTHVAGIITAMRNNGIGSNGIADLAYIMSIRVTPNGDERDMDVAKAIRYAVDNGALVINMSFGKLYCSDKGIVDEAVRYAASRDVLIIHGAGNDAKDLDQPDNQFFPNKYLSDGTLAPNWLTVGASTAVDGLDLVAPFSNYGKKSVDVFAPGVQIYSTIPESRYGYQSGTSMAAPVVAGIAALLREYYPYLTAVQVKEIIMNSVTKVKHPVVLTIQGYPLRQLPFSEVCVAGGIVNLYHAVKLAETYK